MGKTLKNIPVFLFISVALIVYYITSLIYKIHSAVVNLNISNFIVAIILGMLILNISGVQKYVNQG